MGTLERIGNILYLPAPLCLLVKRLAWEMETTCAITLKEALTLTLWSCLRSPESTVLQERNSVALKAFVLLALATAAESVS